jgi:hypothetical protein
MRPDAGGFLGFGMVGGFGVAMWVHLAGVDVVGVLRSLGVL